MASHLPAPPGSNGDADVARRTISSSQGRRTRRVADDSLMRIFSSATLSTSLGSVLPATASRPVTSGTTTTSSPLFSRRLESSAFEAGSGTFARRSSHDVAAQTELDLSQMTVFHMLLQTGSGIASAAHARDHQLLAMQWQHREIDMVVNERFGRTQIFVQHREFLDLVWKLFSATGPKRVLPPRLLAAAASGAKSTVATGGGPLSPSSSSSAALLQASTSVCDADKMLLVEAPVPPDADKVLLLVAENQRLRHRIQALERRLDHKVVQLLATPGAARVDDSFRGAADGASHGPGDASARSMRATAALSELFLEPSYKWDVASRGFELAVSHLVAHQGSLAESVVATESSERQCIEMAAALEHMMKQERVDRSVLVLPPFTSYRPKIPVEHTFTAEDYLRRWLMAEIFYHNEDRLVAVQREESVARQGIEDVALTVRSSCLAATMEPVYREGYIQRGRKIQVLESNNAALVGNVEALALQAKLRILVEEEAHSRAALDSIESDTHSILSQVAGRLNSVGQLGQVIGDLKRTLHEQALRHRTEVGVLRAQLSRITLRGNVTGNDGFALPSDLEMELDAAKVKAATTRSTQQRSARAWMRNSQAVSSSEAAVARLLPTLGQQRDDSAESRTAGARTTRLASLSRGTRSGASGPLDPRELARKYLQ